MKIYTKTGDQGETGILGGARVPKDDDLICAVGEIDETNSHLGLAISQWSSGTNIDLMKKIQEDMFVIGSQIANCRSGKTDQVAIDAKDIENLESAIDQIDASLPPMKAFILPGGSSLGAQLHVSRCVCRRAERSVVNLMKNPEVKTDLKMVVMYLNRLSDLIFVLARKINQELGQQEIEWLPKKSKSTSS